MSGGGTSPCLIAASVQASQGTHSWIRRPLELLLGWERRQGKAPGWWCSVWEEDKQSQAGSWRVGWPGRAAEHSLSIQLPKPVLQSISGQWGSPSWGLFQLHRPGSSPLISLCPPSQQREFRIDPALIHRVVPR